LTIPNNLESGWKSESIDEILDSNKCDFERRKGPLTQQEFESEYSEKKPVILENVSKNELFQQLCSRDYLLQNVTFVDFFKNYFYFILFIEL